MLHAVEEHGELNVVCMSDQNMDGYGPKKLLLVQMLLHHCMMLVSKVRSSFAQPTIAFLMRKDIARLERVVALAREAFGIHAVFSIACASIQCYMGLIAVAFRY